MIKINKRDFILDSIIKAYLEGNEPIGSNELCSRMNDSIPPSTIRVYFKKLSSEGSITQLHVSGGRIPTILAMSEYWKNRLNFDDVLIINDRDFLDVIVKNFGIYCLIYESSEQILRNVINYRNKFIILEFEYDEIVLKFDPRVQNLLFNLIGVRMNELERMSKQIGANLLRKKLHEIRYSKILFRQNELVLFEIFRDERIKLLLEPSIDEIMKENLNYEPLFDEGFMGIKRNVIFENQNSTMICVGSIYNDYNKFFENLKEVA